MKKIMARALVLVMAMALMLCTVACGGESLNFATGGVSGSYYPYGGVLGQVVGKYVEGVSLNVQSTGASKANVNLVASGEAHLALIQNDVMDYAYNGTESFAEQGKVEGFSTVASLYCEVIQIVAAPNAGIETIADLKGKRVSVGDAGSGTEINAKQIMEAYGVSFDDITKQNLSFGDSANALKDQKIDAFFVTAGPPTTAIMELAASNEFKLLSIDADRVAQLVDTYGFYAPYTIKAGTYTGQDEDVATVTVMATLVASSKLSEDTVYNLTKAIFEHIDEIAAANDKGKELSVETAVQGVSVPFHPGAEKYFREIGAIK